MELSKQEMEFFLLFLALQSKNFFYIMFLNFANNFKAGFENRKNGIIQTGNGIFREPIFFGNQNFSGTKIFRDPKFFGTQNFSGPEIFRVPKFFLDQKFLGTQSFSELKIFRDHTFWGT